MKIRIKWKNVILAMLFMASMAIIIGQYYYIFIYPIFSGHITGLTWLGVALLIVVSYVAYISYEVLKKSASYKPKHSNN